METPGSIPGTAPLTSTATAVAAVRWQVGQLLQATVLESNIGKVLLAIGNRQVSSETSLLLGKGQQLTVQVRSLGDLPVLRITSGLNITPLTQAIRTLLPQQGSMTPLLASLARLTQTANPPVPPLIRNLTRLIVNNLADTTAASQPATLRSAIERSGLFLERQLTQQASAGTTSNPVPVSAIQSDFKANLLQLIHQLRNWPGSSAPSSPPTQASGTATTPATVVPTGTPLPPAPATSSDSSSIGTPPRSNAPVVNTGQTAANPAQAQAQTPTTDTGQVRQTLQPGVQIPLADSRPLAAPPLATTVTSTAAGATSGTSPGALPGAPPPFPGAVPAPQAAARVTIDLVNRIGSLNTELLRQTEAALARVQLHQLASQPRDAERSLLEWLLELPVRRGDEIDLWSMRIAREKQENAAEKQKPQRRWSVQLAFDLPGLGPVQAQVTLNGEQVSTRFWTGNEEALPLFQEHLQELHNMLGNVGLEVGELDCVPGSIPVKAAAPSLIREKV
ncbi:hypothetical protein MNBD_GAMMA15-1048 [hydrothermal vent metagenome]|uniref:Flagellar hook-length control protein-like C-terminal domain-containing protein n=1 Tax=hydrothermal vent metagenome TaxID=652676 RepID=A0A3B0Z8M5_9ZZZZ